MHAIFAANAAGANQFQVSLVGQGGRFQRVAGLPAPQLLAGDPPQFRVNQRHQAAQRLFISVVPCID